MHYWQCILWTVKLVYRHSSKHSVNVKAYLLSGLRKIISRIQIRDRVFGKSASADIVEFLSECSFKHELIADEATAFKGVKLNVQILDYTITEDFFIKTVA